MWKLATKAVKSVAAGHAQADLGLQSAHLPNAIVRVGRFLYSGSLLWIVGVWYTGYVNMRTEPGSGPQLVLPGKRIIGPPDRPDKSPSFATSVTHSNTGAASTSTQVTTTPKVAGRSLVALGPNQLGVPGTAMPGYLWSAPNNQKQFPAFNRSRYTALSSVANKIANRYGLSITSGYRPDSVGSLHASGLAFDMAGPVNKMKAAATWAAQNPSLFQEIFLHNEGSGLHLHLGFYPDAAAIYNSRSNSMVRSTSTPQTRVR